jgi:uncharacterized protein YcaQ
MHHMGRKLHFVVMQSVFFGDKEIHRIYDLKVRVFAHARAHRIRLSVSASCLHMFPLSLSSFSVVCHLCDFCALRRVHRARRWVARHP